jgi:hypothetical protein
MIRIFGPVLAAIIVMLSFGLHKVKLDAKQSSEELQQVKYQISQEQQAMQILAAEWSHLNQPAKLEHMSRKYLVLNDVRATQIAAFEDIPYLGLNLFDTSDPFIGIDSDTSPRQKPDLLVQIKSSRGDALRD